MIYEAADGTLAVNEYDWFETLKDEAEPGESARFLIGSAANNVRVLYEIEHDDAIVHKEILTLNREQRLIEIPVEEKHRGNFNVHFSYVKDARAYTQTHTVQVPFSNKKLELEFITFRDKLLPGQQEQWQIALSGPNAEKLAAELLVGMYDASLDAFRPNHWSLSVHRSALQNYSWPYRNINELSEDSSFTEKTYVTTIPRSRIYEALNLFGYHLAGGRHKAIEDAGCYACARHYVSRTSHASSGTTCTGFRTRTSSCCRHFV